VSGTVLTHFFFGATVGKASDTWWLGTCLSVDNGNNLWTKNKERKREMNGLL